MLVTSMTIPTTRITSFPSAISPMHEAAQRTQIAVCIVM